eukprot:UN26005
MLDTEKLKNFYKNRINANYNDGGKKTNNITAQMSDYCRWVFNQDKHNIITTGHSLWFKDFFKEFVKDNDHDDKFKGKLKKIENCGVVAFQLQWDPCLLGGSAFSVTEATITTVYKGFC